MQLSAAAAFDHHRNFYPTHGKRRWSICLGRPTSLRRSTTHAGECNVILTSVPDAVGNAFDFNLELMLSCLDLVRQMLLASSP